MAAPKRPERVKIISKRVTIEYFAEGSSPLPINQIGECDMYKQKILIEDGLEPDTEREVVLHETTHGISEEMNLGLSEKQVSGIAKGILAVFCDNPSFARYLLGGRSGKIKNNR